MVASGERDRNGGGIGEGVTEGIGGDGIAIDVERHAIIRGGAEGVGSCGGDFEETGEAGGGVGCRAADGVWAVAVGTVTEVGDGVVTASVADTSDLGVHHGGRCGCESGKAAREASGGVAEGGHVSPGEDGVLDTEWVRAAETDSAASQGICLADGDEIRELKSALANVDGLVTRVAEDNDRHAGSHVDLWHRTAHRVTAEVGDAEDVAVGRGDVEEITAGQFEVGDHDRVLGARPVISDVEVGNGTRGDDVVGVGDQAQAACAVVLEGEEATVSDGSVGATEDGCGAGVIEAGEGQGTGIDGYAAGEGVVVSEEEGSESFFGNGQSGGALTNDTVEVQDALRSVHGDGGVTREVCGTVQGEVTHSLKAK